MQASSSQPLRVSHRVAPAAVPAYPGGHALAAVSMALAAVSMAVGWAPWSAEAASTPLPASAQTLVIQLDYGFVALAGAMLKCCCACLLATALAVHRACALCIGVALYWPLCTALWFAASCACSLIGVELA